MTQPGFWDGRDLLPPTNRTDTSRAAAAAIRGAVRGMAYRALEVIVKSGQSGRIYTEVAWSAGLREGTTSARLNWLAREGYIDDSGRRRQTPSGHSAKVWVATEKGREVFRDG